MLNVLPQVKEVAKFDYMSHVVKL